MVARPVAVLGIDAGGSRTRARLVSGGEVLAEVAGAGTNPSALPESIVERRLRSLLARLPSRPQMVCAGVAGSESPAARERYQRILSALLPGARVEVVHDARLVLAAAGRDTGVALISGTGSVAYGRDPSGREARAGGWGWMLGDGGSGAWLAREAARVVTRRADAGEGRGALGEMLLREAAAADEVELSAKLNRLQEPRRWAALAGSVFAAAATDPGAAELIERAAAELAELVATVRGRLDIPGPVVLAGGLVLGQPLLEAALRRRLAGEVERLQEPPVAGAVRLAQNRP